MNISYKVNKEQLKKIEKLLSYYNTLEYNKNEHTIFSVKIDKLNITFYKSGKLLIQGKVEASTEVLVTEIKKIISQVQKDELLPLAGSDEAGKGDVFGPLIVAAVFVDEESARELKLLGIDDSKKLSSSRIDLLGEKIMRIVPYSVVRIMPEKYNQLYEKLKNLNRILSWAHWRCLTNLKKKVDFQRAVIDDFGMKEKAWAWNQKDLGVDLILETKAETKYLPVGAASILASYFLNQWFYENPFPRGASQKDAIEEALLQLWEREGVEGLREYAKLNFSQVKRLL